MPNNEFGDFQTPIELARQCVATLSIPEGSRILEPTCGAGTFLRAAAEVAPCSQRIGWELQERHLSSARQWGVARRSNVFTENPADISWSSSGPLFIVGNPPWVTSAQLRSLDSSNVPPKSNIHRARGMDALLGSSNFDVAEFVLLKMLTSLPHESLTLGMLCKTHVARRVLAFAAEQGLPVRSTSLFMIDARRWFGAAVEACWLTMDIEPGCRTSYVAQVYEDVFAPEALPVRTFGVIDGKLVSHVSDYRKHRHADGVCPYQWRSGLKHDAADVFELRATPAPTTRHGQAVVVEDDYLFPLLKSTDVFRGKHRTLARYVIVPQRSYGDDTSGLQQAAPKLWRYLQRNAARLDERKSSIYRNRPRFSVFGHGDYTYTPYKVAVSGLHKQPAFRLIGPLAGKPVVLDDTCYFLPFDDASEACVVAAVLAGTSCQELLNAIVFWDAKRPLTKKILSRINVRALVTDVGQVLNDAEQVANEASAPFCPAAAARVIASLTQQRTAAA